MTFSGQYPSIQIFLSQLQIILQMLKKKFSETLTPSSIHALNQGFAIGYPSSISHCLPSQDIWNLIRNGQIRGNSHEKSVQPASYDPVLGEEMVTVHGNYKGLFSQNKDRKIEDILKDIPERDKKWGTFEAIKCDPPSNARENSDPNSA